MHAVVNTKAATFCTMAAMLLLAGRYSAAAQFDEYSGRQLYERFCASCHGSAGLGDGPVSASLKVMVPDLTQLYRANGSSFPQERVRKAIDGRPVYPAHGSRYMPVWGMELWVEAGGDKAAEAQAVRVVDKLVDYLRSIQR